MMRFYLRFGLSLLGILIAVTLLICQQPYDDRHQYQLRDLLSSAGCPAPCFMGIRPGFTTAKDAVTLLKNQAWVADVTTISTDKPYQTWWVWGNNAPEFLKTVLINRNFPVQGEVRSPNGIVSSIGFSPHLTLGDIVLAWGLPRRSQLIFGGIIVTPNPSVSAVITLEYEADGFWASGDLKCPYTADIWNTSVRLMITNEFNDMSLGTVRAIDRSTFLNSIHRTSNLMCGL